MSDTRDWSPVLKESEVRFRCGDCGTVLMQQVAEGECQACGEAYVRVQVARDTSPAPATHESTCACPPAAHTEGPYCTNCGSHCFGSPAPATVTDEERRALLKKALGEAMIGSRGGLTWEGGYARGWDDFKAAVGPDLARLAELEKMEQRAKDAQTWARPGAARSTVRHILTGSDAEKGKT